MAGSPQDCEDPNPLIRALAVRTMGCIRVDKITEYLCEPLRKCLKDEDPYVRKTAAICVAKLHDINAQLVEDQGFLDTLKDLISDSNPMVSCCHSLCHLYHLLGCLGKLSLTLHQTGPRSWKSEPCWVGSLFLCLQWFGHHLWRQLDLDSLLHALCNKPCDFGQTA